MSSPNDSKWKPESLLDFLLASNGHDLLLTFFGGEKARFQPSEIHVEKKIPDRVFWSENQLFILELKIQIDSRVFSQLDLERAVARSYYIDYGPYPTNYFSKAEAALQNVKVIVFSIFHPS
ncbi:MAG: hypothetical protein ACFFBD_15795, partial [Candidatus Hodarchaeota archaeon]